MNIKHPSAEPGKLLSWFRWGMAAVALALWSPTALAQSLQDQAMCAAQAQKMFQQDEADPKRSNSIMRYEDHYNPKMNRCFLLEHSTIANNGSVTSATVLIDAFEGHVLASHTESDGKMVDCQVIPGHKATFCKSREEFNSFVAQYMGNVFGGAEP